MSRSVEAQRAWAAEPYPVRMRVLRRAGELFVEHAAEIARWYVREAGAARPVAAGQGAAAAEECHQAAALASAPYGEVLRSAQPRLSFARRLPVGVVGVIAPFNAPILLALRSVAPALAVGNAVVLKPDPRTPVVGGVLLARVFEEAGLPEGLLHVPPGGAEVGKALVTHPDVPVLAFTGSTRAGRAIATVEEAVRLARDTPYGLSLGVVTRDVMRGLALAEQVPSGLVHINDQTVNDEPVVPFGGVGDSGNGARHGGLGANLEAFTETQWVTVRSAPPRYF